MKYLHKLSDQDQEVELGKSIQHLHEAIEHLHLYGEMQEFLMQFKDEQGNLGLGIQQQKNSLMQLIKRLTKIQNDIRERRR